MLSLIKSSVFASLPAVRHGFTTRAGGVSAGDLASLNLALRGGETEAALRENWRRVAVSLDSSRDADHVAILHQVHGCAVAIVDAPGGPLAPVATADAAVCRTPGVMLAVRVADCVPVLLASPGGIAVAHAGWRGVASNIVAATVSALAELTGDAPSAMVAAVGPHISGAAFEVGPEVVEALRDAGLDPRRFARYDLGDRPHVDLGAAVADQLTASRVGRSERISACSVGDSRFYSHRRDGERTGRFAGVIMLSR